MENFESQQYRDELAEEIKQAPETRRKQILEKAKEKPEYWHARSKKIKERQNEQEIDQGLGVFIKKKTLYHGSGSSGIKQFNKAEEDTVGSGIYFTSTAKEAIGYARVRSRGSEGMTPVIYESSVENIKLLDLRKGENVKKVLADFKDILLEKIKEASLKWYHVEVLQRAIAAINSGKVGSGNLRQVTFSTGEMFSHYVKSLGYEGLITFEGGEGNIGNHDTYLVFDPKKVKIIQEQKIE